jgi:diguanylate cyclase (GGDEF)-like protein
VVELTGSFDAGDGARLAAFAGIAARYYERLVDAETDPLTRLNNRRAFQGQLEASLRRWVASGRQWHFAVLDIDHFKRINDSYGHRAGDQVLQRFAQALNGLVQSGDYIVRWGGEEFLLVFRPMPRETVPSLGERIRGNIAGQIFDVGEGLRLRLTCSVGLAEYPLFRDGQHPLGWEQTVELADAALYWVKNNGRDGWATLRPTERSDHDSLRHSLQAGAQALIDNRQLKILSSRELA